MKHVRLRDIDEIKRLTPAEQLRLAAGLIEAGQIKLAGTLVRRIANDIGLLLREKGSLK